MRLGRFVKRPVAIDAIQLGDSNLKSVAVWCGGLDNVDAILIPTLEGTMRAEVGDWIVKGVDGEFYPVKPWIFRETYEQVA